MKYLKKRFYSSSDQSQEGLTTKSHAQKRVQIFKKARIWFTTYSNWLILPSTKVHRWNHVCILNKSRLPAAVLNTRSICEEKINPHVEWWISGISMNIFKPTTCTETWTNIQERQSRVWIWNIILHYWKLSSDASTSIITRNIVPCNPSLPKVSDRELCTMSDGPEESAGDIRQQVIRYLNKVLKIHEE